MMERNGAAAITGLRRWCDRATGARQARRWFASGPVRTVQISSHLEAAPPGRARVASTDRNPENLDLRLSGIAAKPRPLRVARGGTPEIVTSTPGLGGGLPAA